MTLYLNAGQSQYEIGGEFNPRESYVGEMSQLHVYGEVVTEEKVAELSDNTQCIHGNGSIISWRDVLGNTHGLTVIRQSMCLGMYC